MKPMSPEEYAEALCDMRPAYAMAVAREVDRRNMLTKPVESRYGMMPRQKQAFDFIKTYIGDRGYSPSVTEIQNTLGLASRSTAFNIIKNLEARGLIRTLPNRRRSIQIVEIPQ